MISALSLHFLSRDSPDVTFLISQEKPKMFATILNVLKNSTGYGTLKNIFYENLIIELLLKSTSSTFAKPWNEPTPKWFPKQTTGKEPSGNRCFKLTSKGWSSNRKIVTSSPLICPNRKMPASPSESKPSKRSVSLRSKALLERRIPLRKLLDRPDIPIVWLRVQSVNLLMFVGPTVRFPSGMSSRVVVVPGVNLPEGDVLDRGPHREDGLRVNFS